MSLRDGVTVEITHLKTLGRESVVEFKFRIINDTDQAASLGTWEQGLLISWVR